MLHLILYSLKFFADFALLYNLFLHSKSKIFLLICKYLDHFLSKLHVLANHNF